MASTYCSHPAVQKAVQAVVVAKLTNASDAHETVRRMWASTISTDRNEIAQVRRIPCRYCYGVGHKYQETPQERRDREKDHAETLRGLMDKAVPAKDWPRFDDKGGVGFTKKRPPHPECPECDGEGITDVLIKDTRHLSPAARAIYDGVEIKNGQVSISIASREKAEERLAKSLGMFIERSINLNGDDLQRLSDIELKRELARLTGGQHQIGSGTTAPGMSGEPGNLVRGSPSVSGPIPPTPPSLANR